MYQFRLPAFGRPSDGGVTVGYVLAMASMDGLCGLIAGPLALVLRFDSVSRPFVMPYVVASLALPFVWLISMALAGTYEERFVGLLAKHAVERPLAGEPAGQRDRLD